MSEEIDEKILAELQKVSTISHRLFWLLLTLVLIFFFSVASSTVRRLRYTPPVPDVTWVSVYDAIDEQDFAKALREAQELVTGQPNYEYGQATLATVYLAIGDITNAEIHASRAYELFPSEANQKGLTAIRKRLQVQQPMELHSK